MININFEALNPLERKIHETLSTHSKTVESIRLTKAAQLCGCSVSKISKFAKKLGFSGYKQYLDFLYGKVLPEADTSCELTRLRKFIDAFDHGKAQELVELIRSHEKIVLFGYGPSLLCAQYFGYRLRTCTDKTAIAVPDELSVTTMTDEKTLLLIFTVTGTFRSFADIYRKAKRKSANVALIIEEYNTAICNDCDKIFYLSPKAQSADLFPYEKTRTVIFIFMEEIIRYLSSQRKTREEDSSDKAENPRSGDEKN